MLKAELRKSIILYIFEKTPNKVIISQIYEYLNEYSKEDVDLMLKQLESEGILVTERKYTNLHEAYTDIHKIRRGYYLKHYPENYPIKEKIRIGDVDIPRLLDGDTARAEDINRISEALKEYTDNTTKLLGQKVASRVNNIYQQMIVIFGIFVSIFAIIVVSSDKFISFDPAIIQSSTPGELMIKSAALMSPAFLLVLCLLGIVMIIKRKS